MAIKASIIQFITKPKVLLWLYILLAIAAALGEYLKTSKTGGYTQYNNYVIFKQSFFHLLHGKDLYIPHPAEQMDLFKYPPVFALFFGSFAWMPDLLGLTCWNLLNALVLFSAISAVKIFSPKQRAFALLFVAIELLTSMQSAQSNGLIAGLMIWAYNSFEDKKTGRAALFIMLATFIKPFGLVAAALFLLYPKKGRFIGFFALWGFILTTIPIVVTTPLTLSLQYSSWFNMLSADHASSVGYSVIGWLQAWFGLYVNKMLVTVIGVILFCTAYLKRKGWNDKGFKLLLLASALIWSVIFNHKAESPTFIIAAAGVALWYFSQKQSTINTVLLALVFIFTILSPTDLFPTALRTGLVIPYQLKVLPCILVWIKVLWDMIRF